MRRTRLLTTPESDDAWQMEMQAGQLANEIGAVRGGGARVWKKRKLSDNFCKKQEVCNI